MYYYIAHRETLIENPVVMDFPIFPDDNANRAYDINDIDSTGSQYAYLVESQIMRSFEAHGIEADVEIGYYAESGRVACARVTCSISEHDVVYDLVCDTLTTAWHQFYHCADTEEWHQLFELQTRHPLALV